MTRRRGFTLIEVLVTLMLIGIVLPTVMHGLALSGAAADSARHRTEAAGLAQSQLALILAGQTWQNGNQSGVFTDWPDYSWQMSAAPWSGDTIGVGLQEIDMKVSWSERNHPTSITLSTLAYPRTSSSGSGTP